MSKERERGLAKTILASQEPDRLREILLDLARAADTAELMLRKDYPDEASYLRAKVRAAKIELERKR